MARVSNIALMAMLAALIAAAGLLLYMSPQASAQAPGPCTGLHRYASPSPSIFNRFAAGTPMNRLAPGRWTITS